MMKSHLSNSGQDEGEFTAKTPGRFPTPASGILRWRKPQIMRFRDNLLHRGR